MDRPGRGGVLKDRLATESTETEATSGGESKIAVVAAVIGNICVGVVKFIAAAISGSAAMFAEGIHSIVDTGNGLLVLLGIRRSSKAPDEDHPLGHGKELYFWTMVVAVSVFAIGGGVSCYEGIIHIMAITPETRLGDPTMSIVVLLIAACIEGASLTVALKQFNKVRGDMKPIAFIRYCKDPSLYTVVLEDSAAEAGLLIAFIGIVAGHLLDNPYLDSIASILISLLLMTVAVILLRETKSLLVGKGLNKPETRQVVELVQEDPAVVDCGQVLSMYMGPSQLLIMIDANFRRDCSADEVLDAIDHIEARIRDAFPGATRVFIENESLKQVRRQAVEFETMESRAGDSEAQSDDKGHLGGTDE